jgi:hypothetical protein
MSRERRRSGTWIGVLVLSLASAGGAQAQEPPKSGPDPFKDMALEQLLKIEIKSVAGLTQTDSRRVPVAITEISAREVEQSGLTDLNHLLEVYVPNMQFIDHHHLQAHLGMNGVISDREDKYLFQVNGRTMNNRMLMGADNERGLPLLGDIDTVSVVRGPASTTHGAGAVAGVIGLQTYTGLTFQGFDARLRQGVVDQFTGTELRYGKKLTDGSGLFAYYGFADQPGAGLDDAPYYLGRSFAARNGLPANVAGEPAPLPVAEYNAQAFGNPHHKAHLSYVNGSFEVWARYVQDGHQDRPMREVYTAAIPDGLSVDDWVRGRQFSNRQTTLAATYKKDLSSRWRVNTMASYDYWWFRHQLMGTQTNAPDAEVGGEGEVFGRAIATWSPKPAHSLAFGSEYSRERFKDPYFSYALDRAPFVTQRSWTTHTVSLLAEYQWKPSERFAGYLSARTDKHTYSDWLFSPRASAVFTPNDVDTFKLMAGKSVRRGGDEELWAEHVRKGTIPAPESLTSYELSYDRRIGGSWHLGAHGFYEDYNAIGWVPALYLSTSIGEYKMAGGDVLLTFNTGSTRVILSEGVAKLVDSSVPASLPPAGQAITARPYLRPDGAHYGKNLAEWAPFITKLAVLHNIGRRFTASTSFVYYSGFQGGQDFADYAATLPSPPSAMPLSDAGYTVPYGPNVYWNLGLECRINGHVTAQVDGYNLVDLFDREVSKRNFYFRLSEFNAQPASLGLSFKYRF